MTDARFPERWLNDRRLLRLSDRDHRTFVTSLVWSVSNRTDGQLEHDDLDLIPGCRPESAAALVKAGLWTAQHSTFQIVDFANTQTSSHDLEVLDNVRRHNREAQKKARDKKRDSKPDVSMTDQPDDIGQARPGQAPTSGPSTERDDEYKGGPVAWNKAGAA